ncbi:MAG: 30S ribosomal protein S13 [Candidatus Zixiibacteriota bacterium]
MARIAGVDLPKNKRIETALTYLYGIGLATSKEIIKATGIDPNKRVFDLTEGDVSLLRREIDENQTIEGDLRSEVQNNIKRLIDIGCYRGVRHKQHKPVRGQRTRTNCRAHKGPKNKLAHKKK